MKDYINIAISKLRAFEGHPYKVLDNEEMDALTKSVREHGVLSPLIVRPLEGTTDEYEVISGHRRLYAAQKAGMDTVPAFIHAVDRDAAAIELVDSNLHRDRLLPSEKAFAYKLKAEALAHQGKHLDLTSGQLVPKSDQNRTTAQIGEPSGESYKTVQRYIRLTNLIPALLDRMDEGKIAFSVGVELSYLPDEAQYVLLNAMERNDCTPSYAQAVRLHKAFNARTLDRWLIETTLAEPKPNQQEHIRLKRENFARFFPEHYTAAQIEQDIQVGLELLRRQRERSRDAR